MLGFEELPAGVMLLGPINGARPIGVVAIIKPGNYCKLRNRMVYGQLYNHMLMLRASTGSSTYLASPRPTRSGGSAGCPTQTRSPVQAAEPLEHHTVRPPGLPEADYVKEFYLLEYLGGGGDGRAWKAFASGGEVCVLKFSLPDPHQKEARRELRKERRRWHALWGIEGVRVTLLAGQPALVMPLARGLADEKKRAQNCTAG